MPSTYRLTEPLITFSEAVMRPEWYRLESGQAQAVWRDQRAGFLSTVVGPHFETLCRSFALRVGPELFGEPVGEVGSGVVSGVRGLRSRIGHAMGDVLLGVEAVRRVELHLPALPLIVDYIRICSSIPGYRLRAARKASDRRPQMDRSQELA